MIEEYMPMIILLSLIFILLIYGYIYDNDCAGDIIEWLKNLIFEREDEPLDNSPFIIIDTQGCGFRIVDKETYETIAEMLPSGRWINYYLGEKK